MIFCDLGGVILPKCSRDARPTEAKRTAHAPTTAAFCQCLGDLETASAAGFSIPVCVWAGELSAVATRTAACLAESAASATVTSAVNWYPFLTIVTISCGCSDTSPRALGTWEMICAQLPSFTKASPQPAFSN